MHPEETDLIPYWHCYVFTDSDTSYESYIDASGKRQVRQKPKAGKAGVEVNVHAEVKMAKRENYLEKPGLTSRVDLGKHADIQSCLHLHCQ